MPTFYIHAEDEGEVTVFPSYALDWAEAAEEAMDLEDEGYLVSKIVQTCD